MGSYRCDETPAGESRNHGSGVTARNPFIIGMEPRSFNEQMEEYLGNMRKIVEETAEMLHERGKMCGMREGNSWREK